MSSRCAFCQTTLTSNLLPSPCKRCGLTVNYCDFTCLADSWDGHKTNCACFSVQEVGGGRQRMVAKETIEKGQLILEEKPIFISSNEFLDPPDDATFASAVDSKVDGLTIIERGKFHALNDPDPEGDPCLKNARIYLKNSKEDGLYLNISRIKHSCKPNALMSRDGADVISEVRALQNLEPGKEITLSFLALNKFYTREERQTLVTERCSCPVCSLEGDALMENDAARVKIRENCKTIESLVNESFKSGMCLPARFDLQLKNAFKLALFNAEAVEDLKEEAGGFLCTTYDQLYLLSTLGQVCNIELLTAEKPDVYKGWATDLAQELGKMFVSSCQEQERLADHVKTNSKFWTYMDEG